MPKIRVVVAEDSLTVRKRLVEVLSDDPGIEVVGEAADGARAVDLCTSLKPDVMTVDMMMPGMSGLAVTEHVMAYCPTPILIVSASMNRGEVFKTYDALAAGAVDVLDKPRADEEAEAWDRKFLATVKLVARIRVITHPKARLSPRSTALSPPGEAAPQDRRTCELVALGASTGGPSALVDILRGLPRGYPLPILLVLHIGAPFGAGFAEWLDGQSPIRVAEARDGEPLPRRGDSRVLMAPPDRHLVVRDGRLRLTDSPERHSCRPSVDTLFESIAAEMGAQTAACLLTGMGRDGADGLLAIRRTGGHTIAQDESTCVVFGMPREAIALGAAHRVLRLDEIAPALVSIAGLPPVARP